MTQTINASQRICQKGWLGRESTVPPQGIKARSVLLHLFSTFQRLLTSVTNNFHHIFPQTSAIAQTYYHYTILSHPLPQVRDSRHTPERWLIIQKETSFLETYHHHTSLCHPPPPPPTVSISRHTPKLSLTTLLDIMAPVVVAPSTRRIKYMRQWLAAEHRWVERHPQSPIIVSPIHDWTDATCEMMLPDYIDEWMDRFPPIGSDIEPKPIKTSKRKAVARALRNLARSLSCM